MPHVDGIMIGRLVCHDPFAIVAMHQFFYPTINAISRESVIQKYLKYAYMQANQGVKLSILGKPVMNIMHGLPFAKRWKQALLAIMQNKNIAGLLELSQSYGSLMR